MIIDGATVERDLNVRTQVCVIGSGAGGAVIAKELAEAGIEVCLLEEGAYYRGKDFTGQPRAMLDLLYRNRGLTGTVGGLTIPIPLGKCVGGTTTVNSGTCYRAPDYVLQAWQSDHGVADVSEPQLRSYFERVERELNVEPVTDSTFGNNGRLFERGVHALGFAGARIPRNAKGCIGTGVCALGCPQDAKQATHVSYVPKALAAGATLYTRCRAERVLTSNGAAFGLVAGFVGPDERDNGRQLHVVADRVVVACGALLTPALLERSAIPDASGWRGRNLHIHPATRVGAQFDEEVRAWEEVPQAYNVHEFTREGIFIQGQFVPPSLAAAVLPGIGTVHAERMSRYRNLASYGALISDVSAGRVRARGRGWPLVTYSMVPEDVRKLTRAISLTAQIFFAAGAREVFSGIHSQPVLGSADEARALTDRPRKAADIELMAFHPQGTCRMGEDPAKAVVDSYGRLHGTRNLLVADASLFPSSCKVNPQITIMALATRIAARLADELKH
ncbi:MAG: GMC family oxidoreductase [Deltaproteobacteria bacterium]|nr:GMC family oxidoreductase [Deltaproteobacteria bacterium]